MFERGDLCRPSSATLITFLCSLVLWDYVASQGFSQAYIINPPSNKTAVLGQRISFTCEARGYPNNITYRWYKDDINVNNLPNYGTRIKIHENDGSLIFAIVEKEDMGWYRCEPSNGYGENPRASAFLNVTYAPEVLVDRMPSTVIWAMGLNESLDCPVDANPPVNNIVWTNNGAVLDIRSRRLQLLENGSLLVRFVQLSDSGNYRCSAFSSFGNMDSKIVQVEVKDPPRFTVRPARQYIRQPAQTVTMSCAAAGTPFPTIMWRRAIGNLVVGGRIQQLDGNLTIYGLQKSDHGVYECEARNEVRKIVTSTELIIQNTTPHAPYNVSVEPTQFTATIRWIPAYSSTPQHFVVWYRAIINGSPQQYTTMRVEPQNATRFTVYMLEPNTQYEFKVLSRNELGAGQYSDPVRARTLGYTVGIDNELPKFPNGSTYLPPIRTPDGPMPSAPVNVSAVLHDKSVTIFWGPPRNTPVKIYAYVVEYRIDGGVWQKTEPLLQQTSVELTELEYGRHYSFRVFSRSVLSYSRPSDEVAVTVPQEKVGLSHTEIGGIIGGLLFLIVAVVLAVVAVICSRRRGRQRRETKYGNVKYLGPQDEIDSRPEYPPEWSDVSQNGRGNIVGERYGKDNQVFVLPQSADMYKGYNREGVGHPRLRKPPPPYGTDGGRQVQTSVNYSRNVSDHPDISMQNYSSQSFDRHSARSPRDIDDDDNGFLDRSGSRKSPNRYRSRSQPSARHSLGPGYPAPERPRSRGHSYHSDSQSHPDVSFLDNTVRYQPQSFQSRPRSRSPHQPTSQTPIVSPNRHGQGHNRSYPSYHGNVEDEDDEEVFMPPPISSVMPGKPGFPRHSSMKPSAQQTYLTDDLDHPSHPFLTNDISSVLPSPFSDSHTKLPYKPYQRQYPSSSDQRVPYGSPPVLHDSSHEPSYTDMDNTVVARQPSPYKSMSRTLSGDRSSSDSSGRPMNYTRDQLLGVVDKVRKGPRAARKGNVPGPRTSGSSAFDSFERPSVGGRHGAQIPESVKPPSVIVRDRPSRGYPQDMTDSRTASMNSSSGLGSALGRSRDPRFFPREDLTPDSLSSGIGSRNTSSQLTGSSLHSRPSRLGSNLTSHEHDLSTDSAQPYLDYPPPHRKDISGDENYEFDSYNAVESDLLEALRNYSEVNSGNDELLNALQDGLNTTGLLHELYPKPSRQSRYSDSEKRFEKLRGEYQKYRQEQQERRGSGLDSNNRSSTYSSNGSGYGSSFVPYSQHGNNSNVSKNYGYPGETNQYFWGKGDNSNYKAGPMDSDML